LASVSLVGNDATKSNSAIEPSSEASYNAVSRSPLGAMVDLNAAAAVIRTFGASSKSDARSSVHPK
jgi:hypothetical protein